MDADRIKIVPNKTLTGCSIVWGFGDPLERPVRITVPTPDAPVGSLDTVVLGMTEEDQPWRHAFRIPTLGAGVSDSGKSSLMQAELIQLGPAIKAGLVRACGIDLKGGNELAFDEPMLTSHARKPESAVALLEQLVTALEDRLDRQAGVVREHTPTVSGAAGRALHRRAGRVDGLSDGPRPGPPGRGGVGHGC